MKGIWKKKEKYLKVINLKEYKGFCFHPNDNSKECTQIHARCVIEQIPVIKNNICPKDFVPSGSVEWTQKQLGRRIKPKYFPEWLQDHIHRKIWYEDKFPLEQTCFLKPNTNYKRFTGFIHQANSYKGKYKNETYCCSEIKWFSNEWRYYVSYGEILGAEWNWGDEVNTPEAPQLKWYIPEDWCGTIDIGAMSTSKLHSDLNLAVIETHHPFACGYYGKDWLSYMQWLIDGWEYLNKMEF